MILSVTLNPCIDLLLTVDGLKPFDTNRVSGNEKDAGGKGINVSRVAAEMGASSLATGFLGGGTGAYILSVLERQCVARDFVMVEDETRINVSVEDGSGRPPTTFNMKGSKIEPHEWEEMLQKVAELSRGAAWTCLGGSLPPGVPADAWRVLGEEAREAGSKVVLDADGSALIEGLKMGPDLIKPNLKEAERAVGRPLEGVANAAEAARELLGKLSEAGSQDPLVLLSMGSEGAILASGRGCWFASPAPITPRSTIGSGDSMIGGFLASLEASHSVEEALAWGSAAGAATASTDGTEIGRRPVIEELFGKVSVRTL